MSPQYLDPSSLTPTASGGWCLSYAITGWLELAIPREHGSLFMPAESAEQVEAMFRTAAEGRLEALRSMPGWIGIADAD